MTWLAEFTENTPLNIYPVVRRTRGGIGYQTPEGIVSTFVGHPVHYLDGGIWKPITLAPHPNGDFEGSDFAWRGGKVHYKGNPLYEPKAVIFNGRRHNLNLTRDSNRAVQDLTLGGAAATYEIIFHEGGVKELLTFHEAVDGLVEFDIPHQPKPDGLRKGARRIFGDGESVEKWAESFTLTPAMQYPLVIDPDYSASTDDDYVYGSNATYSTARSTSAAYGGSGNNFVLVGQRYTGGEKRVARAGLKFDTSGIPDGDSISDCVMKLVCVSDSSVTDFDVVIQKQDWSGQDPIGAGNREAFYDNCLAATQDAVWRNTSGMSLNTQYTSPSLDVTRVSKTGHTYYSLISSRDVSATDPGTGDEDIQVASANHATSGYRPVLTVTHAAGAGGRQNRLALLGVG